MAIPPRHGGYHHACPSADLRLRSPRRRQDPGPPPDPSGPTPPWNCPCPGHDADLPVRLEAASNAAARSAQSAASSSRPSNRPTPNSILARRHGKDGQGITCRGTTPDTFKTVFGTVPGPPATHRAQGRRLDWETGPDRVLSGQFLCMFVLVSRPKCQWRHNLRVFLGTIYARILKEQHPVWPGLRMMGFR